MPTRELQSLTSIVGQPCTGPAHSSLVSYNGPEGFRALRVATEVNEGGIVLTSDQLALLQAPPGMPIDTVPLPERIPAAPSQLSSIPAPK